MPATAVAVITKPFTCQPFFHRRRLGRRDASGTFLPHQVAAAYDFPKIPHAGPAPVIAIIELGGGYYPADLMLSFLAMGLPPPMVAEVSIDGAHNNPGDDADGEVALDMQIAAAGYTYSTGQPAHLLMIWCQNTTASFAKGIAAARAAGAAVLSISWGGPEDQWPDTSAMEHELAANVAAGCTNFAASGDNDSEHRTGPRDWLRDRLNRARSGLRGPCSDHR